MVDFIVHAKRQAALEAFLEKHLPKRLARDRAANGASPVIVDEELVEMGYTSEMTPEEAITLSLTNPHEMKGHELQPETILEAIKVWYGAGDG